MKKLLLIIALIISALGLNAQNIGNETIIDYEGYSLTFTVTNVEPAECEVLCSTKPTSSTEIVIPSSVTIEGMEFSVTSIGKYAFSHCDNLTSIEIPNSVTSIGKYAFSHCDNLTSIEIPNSVTSIGNEAFSYCTSLTSIEIPNSVTSIGYQTFYNCDNLTSIEIPNSVTSIGYQTFYNCNNLTSIEIPNSVTSIDNYAFSYCTSLTSIEIPNSVTSIDNYAFSYCTSLTSIEIPNSVTSIGNEAFSYCTSLTSIEIPNSVTSIGYQTFYNCNNLTSIEIPNSVTSIGKSAFSHCDNLTSIEIPNSVTSIGKSAFSHCDNLTSIYCYAENVPETDNYAFDYCPSDMVIYVPAKSLDAYKAASPWNNYTIEAMGSEGEGNEDEDIVANVGDNTIIDYEGYSLKFTVTSIEPAECEVSGHEGEPVDVTIPSTVTISGMEFSVTSIGENAFASCSNLTNIEIPNSVTSIGNYALWNCSNLTRIEIPSSVTYIENNALNHCNNLINIIVMSGNANYDSRENCNAIIETATNTLISGCRNTIIPNTVVSIGHDAFYSCSNLTSIEIPNSVTSIGDYAFCACDNLTSIEIPNSVTSIGGGAFDSCDNLTSIEIPNSVTSIYYEAFANCSNLTSIYCYAENVPGTVSSAFNYCPSDMIIYVPAQSVDAYKAASPWNEYTIMAMGEPQFATEFFYDFNDGSLEGWRTIDADNDGYEWGISNSFITEGVDGTHGLYSLCYEYNFLYPDNYIVTDDKYLITGSSVFSFVHLQKDGYYYKENLGVVVSENGIDWELIWNERYEKSYSEWQEESISLSMYAGKAVYIGFRHYDCNGNDADGIRVDNVKLEVTGNENLQSNYWKPNESLYANNMSLIGLVQIDGVDQNKTLLEVGAFCGEEVRGSQLVQYIPALDKYLVFLTIHGDSSDEISFKLYDHSIGQELDLRSPEAITFTVNGTLGSVTNPYILNFSNMVEITASVNPSEAGSVFGTGIYAVNDVVTLTTAPNEGFSFKNWTVNGNVVSTDSEYSFVVTEAVELVANYNYVHTRELKSGWSWFSSFIEFDGEEGLEMMEDALGENGLQIKNQTEFVVNSDGEWYGSLMAANSDMMFMLETSAPHTFTLVGPKVNPEEHPLTVGTNWRWISYPLDINLSVEEALATIVPQTGDYIKSKNAFSQYYEGAGWLGALSTMNPGEGYMYQNVSGTTKTLVYPSESATRSMKANVTAENNYWVPNAEKFAGNMSVIAVVESNGIEMSDYEIAAFVGDEVRGSARPIYIEVLDKHMIFMTVYGSGKEEVTFKYYDINADAIENVTSREEIVFADNATYGSIENAIVLTCGVTGIGENDTETLNVYPNPANINAEISLGTTYDRVEIYNAIGVKIAEYADVNRIGGIETAGVYLIKAMNDDATRNCRIVVR